MPMAGVDHRVGSFAAKGRRQGKRKQHQHDDGDDHRHHPFVRLRRGVHRSSERGHREDEHGQGEHQTERATVLGGETLPAMFETAHHEGQTEHEQHIGQDGPDNGGLHHPVETRFQREQDDEQFRKIAEGGLQNPSCFGPQSITQSLHRTADQGGESRQGQGRDDEGQHHVHVPEVQQSRSDRGGHCDGDRDAVPLAQ